VKIRPSLLSIWKVMKETVDSITWKSVEQSVFFIINLVITLPKMKEIRMPFCCQLSSILFTVSTFSPFIFPSQKNKYFAVTYLLLNNVFNVHCHLFCPIPLWSISNLLVGSSFCKWHSLIFYYFPLLKCIKWLEKWK